MVLLNLSRRHWKPQKRSSINWHWLSAASLLKKPSRTLTISLEKVLPNASLPGSGGQLVATEAPGEYIIVTILVGTEGKLELPKINSSDDLRQALRQIGGIALAIAYSL
jgi:hypothetical protein